MSILTEKRIRDRLESLGLELTTEYYDDHPMVRRSTDPIPPDLEKGVILRKIYTRRGEENPLHIETDFNPGIHYSFRFPGSSGGMRTCPNCGFCGEEAAFTDGCEYCGTFFNMDYDRKDTGSKTTADAVLKKKKPLFRRLPVFTAAGAGVIGIGTWLTSRTHNFFDLLKGLCIGAVAGIGAFLVWYLNAGSRLTREENEQLLLRQASLRQFTEAFRAKGLDLGSFYNELSRQMLAHFLDEDEHLADMDLLDVTGQRMDAPDRAAAEVTVRLLRAGAEGMTSRTAEFTAVMKASGSGSLPAGVLPCPGCGASIHAASLKCRYCGREIPYEPPFVLTELVEK